MERVPIDGSLTATAGAWDIDIWLRAVERDPGRDEARFFWNVKDESTLLPLTPDPTRDLLLGTTRPPLPEAPEMPGAAGRIAAELLLRGTIPDYRFPRLDAELTAKLLAAAQPLPADGGGQVDEARLGEYLNAHNGWYLFTIEGRSE
jgi:hypothetical protein